MIQAERLRVVYGSVVAVDELSFTARPGEIFGLLGPNGAGKTTCIHCISGLLKPTAGRVVVTGALGVVPQEIALYDDLSATENLSYWGANLSSYYQRTPHRPRTRDIGACEGVLKRITRFPPVIRRLVWRPFGSHLTRGRQPFLRDPVGVKSRQRQSFPRGERCFLRSVSGTFK
jgi:ABC-type Fe3+/spermidine/putrescine transport system ATPase subunit